MRQQVILYCALTAVASLAYWAWAVANTLEGSIGFDLGSVSFMTAFISSAVGLASTQRRSSLQLRRYHFCMLVVSHVFVIGNYMQGVALGLDGKRGKTRYAVFCMIAATIWAIALLWFGNIARRWAKGDETTAAEAGTGFAEVRIIADSHSEPLIDPYGHSFKP